ncbi:MAG: YbaB/EbfC family nucleoid-associated protein [Pseudomonadota bacterium]
MSGNDDLFDGGFDLGKLQGLLGGVTQQMQRMQAEAEQIVVQGQAGAGMVKVEANGRQEILSVRIDPEAMADRELLEDLVTAAVNDAMNQAREQIAGKVSAMASGLPLPPGLF